VIEVSYYSDTILFVISQTIDDVVSYIMIRTNSASV